MTGTVRCLFDIANRPGDWGKTTLSQALLMRFGLDYRHRPEQQQGHQDIAGFRPADSFSIGEESTTQGLQQQPRSAQGGELRTAPIIFLRSFMLSGPSWFMMPGIISLTSAQSVKS